MQQTEELLYFGKSFQTSLIRTYEHNGHFVLQLRRYQTDHQAIASMHHVILYNQANHLSDLALIEGQILLCSQKK